MSNPSPKEQPTPLARLKRFLRNPKGLLIVVLGALTVAAMAVSGPKLLEPGLIAAVVAAMLVDAPLLRVRKKKWVFPDGALLTGLIVAMILSPQAPWRVAAFAAAVGTASKYLFRSGPANVLNPAALGLFAAYFVFHSGQSWWGALPDVTRPQFEPLILALLIAVGVVVADRVQRMPAALAFLGGHFLLFTFTAFVADPGRVAAIFRSSDLHAVLFCAFFMVSDPPTSPAKPRDQMIFGLIAAAGSFLVSQLIGAVIFLLAGLLIANVWEAWRRARVRTARHAAAV